jgi:hypothetical protein
MTRRPGWAWGAYILPYLEQGNLFAQYNLTQPVQNSAAIQTLVKTYLCPSDHHAPDGIYHHGRELESRVHGCAFELCRVLWGWGQNGGRDRERIVLTATARFG